jgi:plastocyanin
VVSVSSGMNARRRIVIGVLPLLATASLGVVGCSSGSTPPPPATTAGSGASASTSTSTSTSTSASTSAAEFTVKGYKFPAFTASSGQRLTLIDGDGEPHTVTADDGSFDSGSFDNNAAGSLVAPTKPGTYAVHCTVHPSMRGTLTVG